MKFNDIDAGVVVVCHNDTFFCLCVDFIFHIRIGAQLFRGCSMNAQMRLQKPIRYVQIAPTVMMMISVCFELNAMCVVCVVAVYVCFLYLCMSFNDFSIVNNKNG